MLESKPNNEVRISILEVEICQNQKVILLEQSGAARVNSTNVALISTQGLTKNHEIAIASHINGGKLSGAHGRYKTFHNEVDGELWRCIEQLIQGIKKAEKCIEGFENLWAILSPSLIEEALELRNKVLTPLVALDLLTQAGINDKQLKEEIKNALDHTFDADYQQLCQYLFEQQDVVLDDKDGINFSTIIGQIRGHGNPNINHISLKAFADKIEDKIVEREKQRSQSEQTLSKKVQSRN